MGYFGPVQPTKHVPLIFGLQKNMYHFIGNLFEIWHLIHSCKTSFSQCHKIKQLELQILVPVLKFNAINVAQKLGHAAGIETLQQRFLLVRNEAKYICLTPEIRLDLKRVLHVKGNNLINTTIISFLTILGMELIIVFCDNRKAVILYCISKLDWNFQFRSGAPL